MFQFDPKNETNKHIKQSEWKTTSFITLKDCEMHLYYAWFLKKRFNIILNKPLRDPHLSFINDKLDNIQYQSYTEIKKEYNNKLVNIEYFPELIRTNANHWWINCKCDVAEDIREKIGLTRQPFFKFHITLGYVNEKNIEHSQYILRQILKYNL